MGDLDQEAKSEVTAVGADGVRAAGPRVARALQEEAEAPAEGVVCKGGTHRPASGQTHRE
jgi:hypothetical protein